MEQTFNNEDKWALILGGSSGLGLATARKLASEGFNICIVHRDRRSNIPDFENEVESMRRKNILVKTYNLDILKPENKDEVLKDLAEKSVKVLVHSIAKGSLKQLNSIDGNSLQKSDFDITMHAMAFSWYEWTKALIDNNKFMNDARNIAFTSEGNFKVWPGYGAVSAAKSSLESLMRQMAIELAPVNIKTNCIQAGTTKTASFEMIPNSEDLEKAALERNPYKRLTKPEEVANVVYLLSRPEASWINGTIIKVDGGESLR